MKNINDTFKNTKISQKERWRDFLEVVLLVVLFAIFIRTFFVGIYRVSSNEMAPALIAGDFIWSSKWSYGFKIPFSKNRIFEKMPDKGDVIIVDFKSINQSYKKIMRVLAHPGDHVEFKDHQIWVNDQSLSVNKLDEFSLEEKVGTQTYTVHFPIQNSNDLENFKTLVVPPGEVLVMIDNRIQESFDDQERHHDEKNLDQEYSSGRFFWALIKVQQIEAQVKGIWFSLDWSNTQTREKKEPQVRWERVGLGI